MDIPGKRRRGQPNLRWKDACKSDMTEAGLKEDNATNRAEWKKKLISCIWGKVQHRFPDVPNLQILRVTKPILKTFVLVHLSYPAQSLLPSCHLCRSSECWSCPQLRQTLPSINFLQLSQFMSVLTPYTLFTPRPCSTVCEAWRASTRDIT